MKVIISSLFLLIGLLKVSAQLNPYYSGISTTDSGQILKDQLTDLITSTHTTFLSYSPGIWDLLIVSDLDLDDPSKVLLIYGYDDSDASVVNDRTRAKSMQLTGSNTIGYWNREHVFPKSLGTPDLGTSGPGSDGHHLRAADGQMNSIRNNRTFTYGSGNATTVGANKFYPGDEWKGDVARMMMYMYLRYPTRCIPTNVGEPLVSVSTFDQMIDLFIVWNDEDSVSAFEQQRNEVIYQEQGNRNPFIDNQNFATRIWGTHPSMGINPMTIQKIQFYPNPSKGTVIVSFPESHNWFYTITDQLGRIIQSGEQCTVIHLEEHESGTYFITIQTEEEIFNSKLVKN